MYKPAGNDRKGGLAMNNPIIYNITGWQMVIAGVTLVIAFIFFYNPMPFNIIAEFEA
jgi:hypothetical protein